MVQRVPIGLRGENLIVRDELDCSHCEIPRTVKLARTAVVVAVYLCIGVAGVIALTHAAIWFALASPSDLQPFAATLAFALLVATGAVVVGIRKGLRKRDDG